MSSTTLRLTQLLSLLIVFTGSVGFGQGPAAKKQAGSDLLNGEKVLSYREAPLLNPICRFEEHPWFEITNLRPGRVLNDALEMNFACSGPLDGQFHVVVTTNGQRHYFPLDGNVLKKRRGVLTCKYSVIADKTEFGADIEVYIELTDDEPVTTNIRYRSIRSKLSSYSYRRQEARDPLFFKVSRSATRGNVPEVTYAREIRPDELAVYAARRKKTAPPPPPPANTTIATSLSGLVAGTPVFVAHEGEWLQAEVLAERLNQMYVVHWPKRGHQHNALVPLPVIAIDKDVQDRLRSSPESFSASAIVPWGSLQPVPAGYVIPDIKLKLLPGTPVKVYTTGTPQTYTVTNDNGKNVGVMMDAMNVFKQSVNRESVTISKATQRELQSSEAKEIFAARLKSVTQNSKFAHTPPGFPSIRMPSPKSAGYASSTRHYGITIPIPDGYVAVTADTPLKVGMPVSAFWGRKFNDAEVQELMDDGSVKIRWSGWKFIEPVTRESLVVSRIRIAAIENKTSGKAVASSKMTSPSEMFRLNLSKAGARKIPVIKIIMEITDLDLPTAKEVADNVPINLKDGLSAKEVADWKKKLEAAGAEVEIVPSKRKPSAGR